LYLRDKYSNKHVFLGAVATGMKLRKLSIEENPVMFPLYESTYEGINMSKSLKGNWVMWGH
jgi:hypothetical protein